MGARTAPGRRSRIQEIHLRRRPYLLDRQSWRDHRAQARRGRRHCRLRGLRRLRHVRAWICATSSIPSLYGHVQYEFDTFGTIPFHTCYPVFPIAAHPRLQNLVVATHEAARSRLPRELSHALRGRREGSAQSQDHRLLPAPRGAAGAPPTPTSASRAAASARTTPVLAAAGRGASRTSWP